MGRRSSLPVRLMLMSALLAGTLCLPAVAREAGFTAFPQGPKLLTIARGGQPYAELSFGGWGPNWSWLGFKGRVRQEDGRTVLVNSARVSSSDAQVELRAEMARTGPRRLSLDLTLTSDKDTDLTYIIAGLSPKAAALSDGRFVVTRADGGSDTVEMPLARKGLGEGVQKFVMVDGRGRRTGFAFEPALDVTSDGEARIVLARELSADRPVRASITIDFPEPLTYYASGGEMPQESGFEEWYTFQPSDDYTRPSELSMADWLDKPAGRRGRIRRRGDDLYYDGERIKLWGLNLCYRGGCAPKKEIADRRAAFYARNGVNSVRMHKWADGTGWAGIQSADSVAEFEPEGLDLFDYQVAKLKEAGIYVKLSQAFGTIKIGPGDLDVVPYAEEFGQFTEKRRRVGGGNSTLYYSPEIQELTVEQITNLLEHENPHTGLTYAEDPAVAFIEIVNESSVLFYTSMNPLKKSPTLRRMAAERFSDWLKEKYGSQQKLVEAWGEKAFDSFAGEGFEPVGESLEKRNILPLGNPWFWDPRQLNGSQRFRRRRLLDTLEFLYELQNEAYDRIVAGIRAAGYEGEITGSNWQAGRMFSHYANLHSDALVGTIDRHNYFGGGSGSTINNVTMLRVPGSGMLSASMQQVADRPFMLSEWIHVYPNEWGVEGPALIGAYGMGLQGWDVSYIFQNRDDGTFSDRLGRSKWDVTAPQVMGVFPAVARQVLRGDVAEADATAPRYVHVPSLFEGKLDFEDTVQQEYDVKTFDSDKVPSRALAAARCVVDFVDQPRPTPEFDLDAYAEGAVYVSANGQLRWRAGDSKLDGHFAMDTPGTKAVVGFAEGETIGLGQVTIAPRSRFGAVYVTAQGPDGEVATADALLVVAIARARNTGMKVFEDSRIIDKGEAPVVMEPVAAAIRIDRPGAATVHVLDHDGVRTGRTLPVEDGEFTIDGARDRTPYYLVTYGE
ncbi:MAG: beta-galactosidase [Planctomycetota bacterium]